MTEIPNKRRSSLCCLSARATACRSHIFLIDVDKKTKNKTKQNVVRILDKINAVDGSTGRLGAPLYIYIFFPFVFFLFYDVSRTRDEK